jgi:phospholipid/cholesterol/gamma-HCH transport system permease protein
MVLAIETHTQFKSIGQEERLGSVINLSVVKQIGPVLASVDAGGTHRLRPDRRAGHHERDRNSSTPCAYMGADPVRVLVVPRFLACVMLTTHSHHLQ